MFVVFEGIDGVGKTSLAQKLSHQLNKEDVAAIGQKMRKIVDENRPIVKKILPREDVIKLFMKAEFRRNY